MRIVKEAQERKKEILDVAEKLFAVKGYDNTCTNDILEAVGIARGTLYHHFKSKEDILDAVIVRYTELSVSRARAIAENKEIPAFQRIVLAIMAMKMDEGIGNELLEEMHKPQNALMHQKSQQMLLNEINPIISGILKEAVAEGLCTTAYPDEMIEMIMIYSNNVFDDVMNLSDEDRMRKVDAFIYNIERLLCVQEGSMRDTIMLIFR